MLKMKILLSALLIASLPVNIAAARHPSPCLAGLKQALIDGHFTGPLICSAKNATFVLAGRTAGNKFSIYDYRYRFLPEGGNVMHGGQRVVVFRGQKYVGQYMLSPGPYTRVTVKGTQVVLQVEDTGEMVKLDFARKPPEEVYINGETEGFVR